MSPIFLTLGLRCYKPTNAKLSSVLLLVYNIYNSNDVRGHQAATILSDQDTKDANWPPTIISLALLIFGPTYYEISRQSSKRGLTVEIKLSGCKITTLDLFLHSLLN